MLVFNLKKEWFNKIINGKNTDLKINKPVYDIEFEIIKGNK